MCQILMFSLVLAVLLSPQVRCAPQQSPGIRSATTTTTTTTTTTSPGTLDSETGNITALFTGPTDEIWSDDQCGNIGRSYGLSLSECMSWCRDSSDCSAINYMNANHPDTRLDHSESGCILRNCTIPIPTPYWNHHPYQGYSLTTDQFISGLALWEAAARGDLAFVNKALASGTDIHWLNSERDCDGGLCSSAHTALHIAAYNNHQPVVEVLLDAGANKDLEDSEGRTPIYYASLKGNTDVVATLIDYCANVQISTNMFGWSPLHAAAYYNNDDDNSTVLLLLQACASRSAVNRMPWSDNSAEHARKRGNNKIAEIIEGFTGPCPTRVCTYGQPTSDSSGLALWEAAARGDLAFINKALASGTDIHWLNAARDCSSSHNKPCSSEHTALHVAAFNNHQPVVKVLLDAGANKDLQDSKGRTPMYYASVKGNTDVVATLIDYCANVQLGTHNYGWYGHWSPLHAAAYYNNDDDTSTVLLLLQACASRSVVNRKPWELEDTPAEHARKRGNNKIADIIDGFTGPCPTRVCTYGQPISGLALWEAAARGDLAFVNKALASGTDIHWLNPERDCSNSKKLCSSENTALHIAAFNNHQPVVEVLLDAGANKDLQDSDGRTPIYLASWQGNPDVVATLIDHCANVQLNAWNGGWSPLHAAAYYNNNDTSIALLLLQACADRSAVNRLPWSNTPAEHARQQGNKEIADIIDGFTGPCTNRVCISDTSLGYTMTPPTVQPSSGPGRVTLIWLPHPGVQ